MNEQAEQPVADSVPLPLDQQLEAWLKEHDAVITVKVLTPARELIRPENFVPAGWLTVWDVVSKS